MLCIPFSFYRSGKHEHIYKAHNTKHTYDKHVIPPSALHSGKPFKMVYLLFVHATAQ